MSVDGSFSRGMLFAPLYFVGILNGFAADVINTIQAQGFWSALAAVFNISVIAAAASVLALTFAYPAIAEQGERVRVTDIAIAVVVILMILAPHRSLSWAALTALAGYDLLRNWRSVNAVAAASLVLALAASSFWSNIVIQAFAEPLLAMDTVLIATVLSTITDAQIGYVGNVISISGQAPLVVIVGCDSLTNLVLGFLCWLVIVRFFNPRWQWHDLIGISVVSCVVVISNSVRVALMGLNADMYQWVHDGSGVQVFNFALLVLVSVVSIATMRSEDGFLAR